jgi:cell division protein YceG involved in septum cleavage
MKHRSKILAIAITFALLFAGFAQLGNKNDYPKNKAGAEIEFFIQDGELGSSIAKRLEAVGVIKSSVKFVEDFTNDPKARGISAGSHSVQKRIPTKEAIAQLLDPKRINNLLIV